MDHEKYQISIERDGRMVPVGSISGESYRNSERISYTWIHLKNGIITKRSPGPGGNGLVNQFLKTAGGMRKTERSLILRWTRPAHGGQALQRSDPFFPDDPRCRF
jgi:hypothetical protein